MKHKAENQIVPASTESANQGPKLDYCNLHSK